MPAARKIPPIPRRSVITAHTNPHHILPLLYSRQFLLDQSRWIRDDLDQRIAREGPDALHPDDVLVLDEFLRQLLHSKIAFEDIRFSRLHHAILEISGQATRWPKKLIDKTEVLRMVWEQQYGPLEAWGTPLYGPGGRLSDMRLRQNLSSDRLILKRVTSTGSKAGVPSARKSGDLGFKPGDWWISALFAFKDGIVDNADQDGWITANTHGAYAVLMSNDDETNNESPTTFTYKTKVHDRGRYRLTAITTNERHPVRILRSHSLRSFWAPQAGVRYDGLCARYHISVHGIFGSPKMHILIHELTGNRHKVVGWSVLSDAKTKQPVYYVNFERLPGETSMDAVLRRPYSDEIEDYKEFKRLRQVDRSKQSELAWLSMHAGGLL